jgi:hypothetical protein
MSELPESSIAERTGDATRIAAGEPAMWRDILLANREEVLRQAAAHGVSVPTVLLVLRDEHGLGSGYIMSRERGEALPFRILADAKYAGARRGLAFQCGEALGKIFWR